MNDSHENLEYGIHLVEKRSGLRRLLEIYFWIILGFMVSGRFWFDLIYYVGDVRSFDIVERRYVDALFGLTVFIFPFLYNLIFGSLPLESIRNKREEGRKIRERPGLIMHGSSDGRKFENSLDDLVTQATIAESSENYFAHLVIGSRKLARSLYSRAGVYMIIGVLIAFSGLGFFYILTSAELSQVEPTNLLIALAPKFGILFFIEFIALFFLRQYRSAMDEFRYYESLQRSREETLAVMKMLSESENAADVFDMINKAGFRSTYEKLEEGETTDLIESKKLNKDEAEIFRKLVDVIGKR